MCNTSIETTAESTVCVIKHAADKKRQLRRGILSGKSNNFLYTSIIWMRIICSDNITCGMHALYIFIN